MTLDPETEARIEEPASADAVREARLTPAEAVEHMLLRPGPIPAGEGWAFELKWDGFRAIVSTENDLRVRSRRGC